MVFLRGVCGLHRAVLSHGFYCVYVCAPVHASMCMYVCFAFLSPSAKVKYILKKKKIIYIYILPFSFSGTGLLALLGTNVLGFFHFMKLQV